MAVRRSIVDFEKWVDGQIAEAQLDLAGLTVEAQEVERRSREQTIRLDTLREVKAKLALPVETVTEHEPDVLAFHAGVKAGAAGD